MCKQRLVWGFGINDSDYTVQKYEYYGFVGIKQNKKLVWMCPFYSAWKDMLKRCYSERSLEKNPTYRGCTVSEEWKLFSNFRKWMKGQDWEGMQLDKDVLFVGNRVYSSEMCVFVSRQVNNFLTNSGSARGEWPIGVNWHKVTGKFVAQCSNPFTGKSEHLGLFTCPQQAHKAWLSKKLEHAYALAAIQTDPRVAKALIERYENYVPDVAVKEKVT